jgi:hypothetical protein
MTGWAGTGRFAERARPFCPIAENRGPGGGRRAQLMKNAAQLVPLGHSLRRHAAKDDLLPVVVCDLGEQDLERTPLILTSRSDMAAINGERDRFRFHQGWFCHLRQCDGFLFQPGAHADRALAGRLHRRNVVERQKLRQQRPGTPVRQRRTHLRDNPLDSGVHRAAMISLTGLRVWGRVTAQRQCSNRGAETFTVPNKDTRRRDRLSLIRRGVPHRWHRRRRRQ